MSARKRINKTKFYAINRDIKSATGAVGAVKTIALVHNVSEETVRTVKRAKTWPRFEAMKKLKNEHRRPTQVKETTISSAPIPVAPIEEQLDKITQAPENQIRPLPSEEVKVLTVGEWKDLLQYVDQLHKRLNIVRKDQLGRKPLLSIFRRAK